jgi:carboxyl-terminal processing protease
MSRFAGPSLHVGRLGVFFGGLAIAVSAAWVTLSQTGLADLAAPRRDDRIVTNAVTGLLRQQHLSKHPLDDEISRRWMKTFLKTLDPMKVYFVQSDVDGFMKKQDELDDMVKRGDISMAYTIFNTFLKRVDERAALVDELVKQDQDFTVDEEMNTDPEAASYAKSDADVRDIWRKRIKYDFLVLKASDKEKEHAEGKEAQERLSRRYRSFAKRMHQTDADELLEMYLTAMTMSFDPHTTYMSKSSLENFDIVMRLKLEGIGAALQFTDGYTVVSKIIPGGAADKDGRLKPEDKVVGVGQGDNGTIEDVVDMKLNDVVKLIRGPRASTVRLEVIPASGGERKIYNIVRAEIELKDSEARSEIIDAGRKPDGSTMKVGVINLPSFYMDMERAREGDPDFKSTTRDVEKLLKEFRQQNVDGVILDLRLNGGGSLTEAINLTGLFIDSGPVVQVKDADGKIQHYDDPDPGMRWNGPLVVLTSKFSASASEIFAGAIQDYRRGLVIGDTSTHGKGTVQSLIEVGPRLFSVANPPQLGALKITMQQFYRPNGDSTQNRGVLADIELPSLTSQLDVGETSLDYAMKFDHINPVNYRKLSLVDKSMVDQLKAKSAERLQGSEDFAKVQRNITRYNEQKQKKRVSLNEEKFLAERKELNAEREEEKEFEEQNDPDRPVVKRDYYFNEALAITADYVGLLRSPRAEAIGRR